MPEKTKNPRSKQPHPVPAGLLGDDDLHLFNEGSHYRLYERLGAHVLDGGEGTHFAVWAPNAQSVSLIGDFNDWRTDACPLQPRGVSGIWWGIVPEAREGTVYKYHIESSYNGYVVDKADPFGFMHERPPQTASVVRDLRFEWSDDEWMRTRGERQQRDRPMSIYEMHLGSWRRHVDEDRPLTYREIAEPLADYLCEQGFTHVELMPVMHFPYAGSWGYQVTGYYAASSRYGTPQDLMHLIDTLHRRGIGVILDWVPSHFPTDEHGLQYFDGTHVFEHADPRQGFHPDWTSSVFNYGRREICSFLISNALFWLEKYHADGLRVDAVASMLYLDYSRKDGEWVANEFGGRENIEAIEFLRTLNTEVYRVFPDVQMIAEESTAWPMVSRPTHLGGLGFGFKWDMGWMHDTLRYLARDPIHRKWHHHELTFRAIYQFSENYILPLSHDEVVHGKGSLLGRMPGDDWQKFANLRLLLSSMWAAPGKKLLFMGGEIGQFAEWNYATSIDWHLLEHDRHAAIQRLVRQLNRLHREEPALHEQDCEPEGFAWLDPNDVDHSVYSFLRRGEDPQNVIAVVLNATSEPRYDYQIGVPHGGYWKELLNSDAREFGGSGLGNLGGIIASAMPYHQHPHTLSLTLPPLGAVYLRFDPAHPIEEDEADR